MKRGYVRLWRKSIDGGLIKNHKVWIFWTWCLLKANHEKDYKQIIGFQEVILQPGEFVFGRKAAARETGLSEQNIRTCIKFLKNSENLTIKPTNKFSILSIINWEVYQFIIDTPNQQSNQHLTSIQPASNHKQEPINNKTVKPIKKKVIKKKPSFIPPVVDDVCKYFLEKGFREDVAIKAFEFYSVADWKDSRGNQVKNWKQKMNGVWFKDENKRSNEIFPKTETKKEMDDEIKKALA